MAKQNEISLNELDAPIDEWENNPNNPCCGCPIIDVCNHSYENCPARKKGA